MNKLQLMAGTDIPVVEIQSAIHQPTIREISYLGEAIYFSILQSFCFNKEILIASNPQGKNQLSKMNNFQIFMMLMLDPRNPEKAKRQNDLISVLALLFPGYKIQFLPNGLFFSNQETKNNFTLDERNFDAIKEVLNNVAGLNNTTGGQNSSFKPKNKKAAEIAAKLMRGRSRAAQDKGYSADGVLSRYVSILTIGLQSMSLNDCLNLTVYQLYDLVERYGLYVGWDLDIRSRLAGGKPDSKPDDWMKDLHN